VTGIAFARVECTRFAVGDGLIRHGVAAVRAARACTDLPASYFGSIRAGAGRVGIGASSGDWTGPAIELLPFEVTDDIPRLDVATTRAHNGDRAGAEQRAGVPEDKASPDLCNIRTRLTGPGLRHV
jgi:hypothetical protein